MTVLITGGAGYIGSNLARLLVKKKNKVCIVDNLSENNKLLIPKKAILLVISCPKYWSSRTKKPKILVQKPIFPIFPKYWSL